MGFSDMKIPNAKALSRLGPRGTFGLALQAVAEENPRVLGISADLAVTAGMDRFRVTYPERFFNVGIAEQNLLGIASGLADDGWVPFAVTFANFAALRANEFVRHHMAYMGQNIKLVGIGAGFAMGQFGTTHYSIEDVSALRGMPNLTIVAPADCAEVVAAVRAAAAMEGPIYLRLNGAPSMPMVDQADTAFELGKARRLSAGTDATVFAAGSMVAPSLKAAAALADRGLSIGVTNMHTIKPLDTEAVLEAARGSELIITAEEHSVIGGLGGAVAEYLSSLGVATPLLRLGVGDRFPRVGNYGWVIAECGLDSIGIADSIWDYVSAGSKADSRP